MILLLYLYPNKPSFTNFCRFKGRKYNTCINLDVFGNGREISWCSTVLDSKGNHVPGSEDECNDNCAVSNCPVGFHWVASTGTCYMVLIYKD